jgi:hypothetical protein
MLAQNTNHGMMCTEDVFYMLWLRPCRKEILLTRIPYLWRRDRGWLAYLIICSLLEPITPPSTPFANPVGLLVPSGSGLDVSTVAHASKSGSMALAGSGNIPSANIVISHGSDTIVVDESLSSGPADTDADFGRRLVRGPDQSMKWLVAVLPADAPPSSSPTVVELESTDWGGDPCKEILVSRTWPAPTLPVVWKAIEGRPESARKECQVLERLARAGCRVPKCLGLYRWVACRGERLLLATIFCGQPVRSFLDFSLDQRCERPACFDSMRSLTLVCPDGPSSTPSRKFTTAESCTVTLRRGMSSSTPMVSQS